MYHNRSDIISISIFFCHVQLGCIVMSTDNQKLISKDQIFPNDKTIHCFTARFLCLKISAKSSQGTNHTCTEQLSKHQGFLVPKWDFWSSVVVCTILITVWFLLLSPSVRNACRMFRRGHCNSEAGSGQWPSHARHRRRRPQGQHQSVSQRWELRSQQNNGGDEFYYGHKCRGDENCIEKSINFFSIIYQVEWMFFNILMTH